MFIVLEGADGTGKSTLTSLLAEKIGGVPYATPPKRFRKDCNRVHRDADPEEHYRFFKEGLFEAEKEIGSLLEKGSSVVCDRYWLSTVIYHEILGAHVNREEFDSIVKPDLTFFLVADSDTQIKRMIERGMDHGDKAMELRQQHITDEYFKVLIETKSRFIAIDTRKFSVEETVDAMEAIIECL
jgi:thymidylate kinase